MGWFGPSKNETWRQFSEETGAQFIDGGFWKPSKVQAQAGPWTITLDTYTISMGAYTESSGKKSTHTRIRAPFVNPDGFRFNVYRKGVLSGLGKLLGMQDIEIGDMEFDDAFVVQGNDEDRVRSFFADPEIRRMIADQPKIQLGIKTGRDWFEPRQPEHVHELQFREPGVLKDVDRLKALFNLIAAVLDRLQKLGLAHKQDPEIA